MPPKEDFYLPTVNVTLEFGLIGVYILLGLWIDSLSGAQPV